MSNRTMMMATGLGLALSVSLLVSSPAVARDFERCDMDGEHCVRIKCDRDGDRCWRASKYAHHKYYHRPGHWVCDEDRDRCHYVYAGREWHPRHWEDGSERHDD